MAERAGHAAHDRQPKPQPAADQFGIGGNGAAVELLEDRVSLRFGNAASGVGDVDAHGGAAIAHAHENAAGARVAQRIGQHVLQDAPQHRRVGADHGPRFQEFQRQALTFRQLLEIGLQRGKQRFELDVGDAGLNHAGVET